MRVNGRTRFDCGSSAAADVLRGTQSGPPAIDRRLPEERPPQRVSRSPDRGDRVVGIKLERSYHLFKHRSPVCGGLIAIDSRRTEIIRLFQGVRRRSTYRNGGQFVRLTCRRAISLAHSFSLRFVFFLHRRLVAFLFSVLCIPSPDASDGNLRWQRRAVLLNLATSPPDG